jgi:hypothetical protein
MPVILSLCTAGAAVARLRHAGDRPLRHGLLMGVAWLAVSLALDGIMFSGGPMQMGLVEYLKDIGATYLIIPIITMAMGLALEQRKKAAASA